MDYQRINEYLTSIFNNVLVIEEVSLRGSRFKDISIKEMHTIDVIGKVPDVTPSQVSKELMVTLGTVTTSLNNLERKGYIERIRSEHDRRVVHLHLTKELYQSSKNGASIFLFSCKFRSSSFRMSPNSLFEILCFR